eukprot:CAMPEP_0173461702 /NCGR_PEP_ID=MMETSP1357-20121228/65389_1 /TAXON_ID=77926 /ORGANISM="Hemiselmis rufescens, Strain PCC563" /LENGTH=106 /DNA_ID=CAMNT_0014429375 /DNA_START=250 /DNA_END=567 /DNA_ORIENTATION=+
MPCGLAVSSSQPEPVTRQRASAAGSAPASAELQRGKGRVKGDILVGGQHPVGTVPPSTNKVQANHVRAVGDGDAHYVWHLGIEHNVLEDDGLDAYQLVPAVVDGGG